MDTQFNEYPFSLAFFQGKDQTEVPLATFYKNEKELYENKDNEYIVLVEYLSLSIKFEAETKDAKFYMDGLDTLPERMVEENKDGGDVYLLPSKESILLYENNDEYYPFIPGFYRIIIEVHGELYYSWVKVVPKQIGESQWDIMKSEVEAELQGLAQDFIRRNLGIGNANIPSIPPKLLRQFIVIQSRFSSIMAAISDLMTKVNFSIRKDYQLIPKEKSKVIDAVTIQHRLSHPENEHMLKTPARKIEYDLPENRIIKKIIEQVINCLTDFISSIEAYCLGLEQEIEHLRQFQSASSKIREKQKVVLELNEYLERSKKMRGGLQSIKTAPWYSQVSKVTSMEIPHVMNSDSRYRALFQLHRELSREDIAVVLHQSYSYQWKRTDKLYEIWGFLQFIKALSNEKLGFKATKGWVFDANFQDNTFLIPTLPSGTTIVFKKDDLKLHLTYDAIIPSESKYTNENEKPLYTSGTHNRPDGRLDVYKDENYIGSLLFDFKYRPRRYIWEQSLVASNRQSQTMKQLISYGFNSRSTFLYGDYLNRVFLTHIRPVQEVWALFPTKNDRETSEYYSDHDFRIVSLSPSFENGHLIGDLEHVIESLISRRNSLPA